MTAPDSIIVVGSGSAAPGYRLDLSMARPTGEWFILRSEDNSFFLFPFGASGDFDGDGRADTTLFRPSSATWFIDRSAAAGILITNFGTSGDQTVPNIFVPLA